MICHLSLAIAILNLGLILHVIRRAEKQRAAAKAADHVLSTILKRPPEPRKPRVRPE